MEGILETPLVLASISISILYLWWRWKRGWRPLGIVLLIIGWQRLTFYIAWLRFSWLGAPKGKPPQSD
jgi:hypothetical protein